MESPTLPSLPSWAAGKKGKVQLHSGPSNHLVKLPSCLTSVGAEGHAVAQRAGREGGLGGAVSPPPSSILPAMKKIINSSGHFREFSKAG